MIQIRDLSYVYTDNGAQALLGVGLSIQPGECVGLVGPAGAGKSTACKLLDGTLALQTGHVQIAGCDRRGHAASLEQQIGALPQQVSPTPRATAYEALALAARRHNGSVEDPLALLSRLGLRAVATRRLHLLTPGMLRRLSLACALVHRPRVLLLDEPLAGMLDDEVDIVRAEIARQRAQETTILISTRDAALADALALRVVRLLRGRVVGEAAPLGMRLRPE